MSTVSILPVDSAPGTIEYQATAGTYRAVGGTAGQALDALTSQFPEVSSDSLVVIQRLSPDQYFSVEQRDRLQHLMQRWRAARDAGQSLAAEEQAELEQLTEAELQASARRAADAAKGLGR